MYLCVMLESSETAERVKTDCCHAGCQQTVDAQKERCQTTSTDFQSLKFCHTFCTDSILIGFLCQLFEFTLSVVDLAGEGPVVG